MMISMKISRTITTKVTMTIVFMKTSMNNDHDNDNDDDGGGDDDDDVLISKMIIFN